MGKLKKIMDYLHWMFFPSKFIFPSNNSVKIVPVPGWEVLELVSDQKRLKEINKGTGHEYLGGKGNEFLQTLFGNTSVFTLDGRVHKIARKLIASELSSEKVSLTNSHITASIQIELDNLRLGEKIDVGLLSRSIAMRSVLLPIVGDDSEELFEQLLKEFEGCTGFIANLVSYNKYLWGNGKVRRFSISGIVRYRVQRIDEVLVALIDRRKKEIRQHSKCVLDRLIVAQVEYGYSDQFIRDNIVSTIAAGYDTSGSSLTWMLYWLSKPGQYTELSKVAKSDNGEKYLDSFICESLRYCPPLEILPRRIMDKLDSEYKDGVTLACPCPHLVHHDDKIYENPERFVAERFVDKKFSATEFFPYGAASRMCLGSGLANAIMKSTLHELLNRKQFIVFRKLRFSPVRRNVSIWPGILNAGELVNGERS